MMDDSDILILGQSLSVESEEGFLTKDAWIEYDNQRFASLQLWFAAVLIQTSQFFT
jgi:hypothetical protein